MGRLDHTFVVCSCLYAGPAVMRRFDDVAVMLVQAQVTFVLKICLVVICQERSDVCKTEIKVF